MLIGRQRQEVTPTLKSVTIITDHNPTCCHVSPYQHHIVYVDKYVVKNMKFSLFLQADRQEEARSHQEQTGPEERQKTAKKIEVTLTTNCSRKKNKKKTNIKPIGRKPLVTDEEEHGDTVV